MADKPDPSADYIQRLLDAEEISPALRSSYQGELDAMLHPKLTTRRALPGIFLLVILLLGIAALVRNIFVHDPGPLALTGWLALAGGFSCAACLIARDLWFKRHTRKTVFSISHILAGTAGAITAVAVLQGMSDPANPASTFHVLFTLVFYVACLAWNLDSRIAAAELAAREQMLRIEYRLADLAERLR